MKTPRALVPLVLVLSACGGGPDLTPFKGTWTGSGSLNTGRAPLVLSGTMTIPSSGLITAEGKAQGGSTTYSTSFIATDADDKTLLLKGPIAVTLTATPADGCTREVTVDEVTLDRIENSMRAVARGLVKTNCASGSTATENFLLSLDGKR